ncbi:hypothetical protein ACEPAH_6552 [Sanghuangporus vaninii]
MAGAKLINRQDQSDSTGSCGDANLLGVVVCAASTAGAKSTISPDESTISCTRLPCSILPPSTDLATTFDAFSDPPPSTAATINPPRWSRPTFRLPSLLRRRQPPLGLPSKRQQRHFKSFRIRPASSGRVYSFVQYCYVSDAFFRGKLLLGSSLSEEHEDEENLEAMRAPISSKVTEKGTKSVSLDSSSR